MVASPATSFSDRYHLRILNTPRETYLALGYILSNARRHAKKDGVPLEHDLVDPISSAFIFVGAPLAIAGCLIALTFGH